MKHLPVTAKRLRNLSEGIKWEYSARGRGSVLHRLLLLTAFLLSSCSNFATTNPASLSVQSQTSPMPSIAQQPTNDRSTDWCLPPTRQPGKPLLEPTPDAPHSLPALRNEPESYIVQPGDSLAVLANLYAVPLTAIITENNIENPNLLEVGQTLSIPAPMPGSPGPAFKMIPDSELVNGPAAACFDTASFIQQTNGYLNQYTETVDGHLMTGAAIVDRIASEYSVNPRLLLALLEHQSNWISVANPDTLSLTYPIQLQDIYREGLYRQLAWAANQLNLGYYLYQVNGFANWVTTDSAVIPLNNSINPGTAGVQHLFSHLLEENAWRAAVGSGGFQQTYQNLFGYPFDLAIEPLIPSKISQPAFQLPFEMGATWSFTGGPHGGWGDGAAWAALDFAPPGDAEGCVQSDEWVVALADGIILYSADAIVIQDIGNDGSFQTGWSLFYGHIETRDRVTAGTRLKAGDRIGHPSCEGGVSSGTHVHIARRYNGEWIAADASLPFVMDGWSSSGTGTVYNGILQKNGQIVEAWDERKPENQIHR
jgi:LasA protease